jgi:hypothetical protein
MQPEPLISAPVGFLCFTLASKGELSLDYNAEDHNAWLASPIRDVWESSTHMIFQPQSFLTAAIEIECLARGLGNADVGLTLPRGLTFGLRDHAARQSRVRAYFVEGMIATEASKTNNQNIKLFKCARKCETLVKCPFQPGSLLKTDFRFQNGKLLTFFNLEAYSNQIFDFKSYFSDSVFLNISIFSGNRCFGSVAGSCLLQGLLWWRALQTK